MPPSTTWRPLPAAELEERRDPPYPPHSHLANLVVSGEQERAVEQGVLELAGWLAKLFESRPESRLDLVGPAPCPIEKVRGRFRWHLLLRTTDAKRLTQVLAYVVGHAPSGRSVRLVIDRDPVSLL